MPLGLGVLRIIARVIFTPLLLCLLALAFGSCIAAEVVKDHLLNADFYLDALAENDAYSRVQRDFLLDFEQAGTTDDLVAGTEVTPEEVADLVGEIITPEFLQEQFEFNVRSLVDYLRADIDELDLRLELGPVLERIGPAVSAFIVASLGELQLVEVDTYADYRSGLTSAIDTLTDGATPTVLPTFQLSDQQRNEVIDEVFAAASLLGDDDTRAKVDDALRIGATDEALIAVVEAIVDDRIEASIADLREELDDGDVLDIVDRISRDEGQSRARTLEEFENLRSVANFFLNWGRVLSFMLFLLATVLLVLLYLPSRLALLVPGILLSGLGACGLIGWALFRAIAPSSARDGILDNETDLSPSAVEIAADVVETLVRGSAGGILQPSLLALALGGAGIAAFVVLKPSSTRTPGGGESAPVIDPDQSSGSSLGGDDGIEL